MIEPVYLRQAHTSLLMAVLSPGASPQVLHWGEDLGDLSRDDIDAIIGAMRPPEVSDQINGTPQATLLPDPSYAWFGTPGFSLTLDGGRPVTRLVMSDMKVSETRTNGVAYLVTMTSRDEDHADGPAVTVDLEMYDTGLIRIRACVTAGAATVDVGSVTPLLPVPQHADELMDFFGRHLRERHEQRLPFAMGTHLRESRRGRTSLQASTVLAAGSTDFGHRRGQVWATHVGWSGDQRLLAERVHTPHRVIGGGELLHPGEIVLAAQENYTSPWTYFAYGVGTDAIAHQFHTFLRSRPLRSTRARPVTLNTWEAVYFDHNIADLTALAERAAETGVERFVLDDGWFGSRRDDTSGLGDWTVSDEVWPDGLGPLITTVHELGMEFGLWVEPEMINPDSDLARRHPDWILGQSQRDPITARNQQVLDLSNPAAYDYIKQALMTLLDEYPIAYLKWDHNRDLLEPVSRATGRIATHAQTLATYRLMAELKEAYLGLEIESCSSGGGRIDLGVMEVCDRVWTSDCIDPVERVEIQRGTSLLIPSELMGAHIGSQRAHTTGRVTSLDFRIATALSGHLGIEWDLCDIEQQDLAQLREAIELWKQWRDHLATSRQVRVDDAETGRSVVGFVDDSRDRGLFVVSSTATSETYPSGRLRLSGLDPERRYHVSLARRVGDDVCLAPWLAAGGATVSGRVLMTMGVASPTFFPASAIILDVRALTDEPTDSPAVHPSLEE